MNSSISFEESLSMTSAYAKDIRAVTATLRS